MRLTTSWVASGHLTTRGKMMITAKMITMMVSIETTEDDVDKCNETIMVTKLIAQF